MNLLSDSRRLWHEVFGDDPKWIEMYLRHKGGEDNLLYRTDSTGSHIVSQLYMPQYHMTLHGQPVTAAYITGAATSRAERSQGHMGRLVRDAIRRAYERGDAMLMLIPAERRLYGYYDRFGFSTVFYVDREHYTSAHIFESHPDITIIEYTNPEEDARVVGEVYNRLTADRSFCVLHADDEFVPIMADIISDGGVVLTATHAGSAEPVGIALALSRGGHIIVRDIAAGGVAARDALLAAVMKRWPGQMLTVESQPGLRPSPIESRGMGRIANVESLLTAYAASDHEASEVFEVSDPIIEANNGVFEIKNGVCRRLTGVRPKAATQLTITTLLDVLCSVEQIGSVFGLRTSRPFMSLMMD